MAKKQTVVLGITGSIAAYKSAEIISRFIKLGIDVRVILTKSGAEFITRLTLETLSKAPVACSQFSRENGFDIEHISLAKLADVFLVAPATANFIGKAANGIADDLLTSTYLATTAPIVIAPAMNTNMYNHAATKNNMSVLKERGHIFVEPSEGMLACGDVGKGRLAEIDDIISTVLGLLNNHNDLAGKRILVTAGPTREMIDPVRFLSNRSSGKMGFAIAEAAKKRGAQVKLISGPVNLETPSGVLREDITSSKELCAAVQREFNNYDALIMAAAPADFTFTDVAENKIKKSPDGMSLNLTNTTDILASIADQKGSKVVMGFAAETENLEQNALGKLKRKNLDFIAANNVAGKETGFGVETNAVTLYSNGGGRVESGLMSKHELANWLLDALKVRL